MTKRNRRNAVLMAAVASVAAGKKVAQASQLVNVTVLGSTTQNGTYTPSLQVTAGQTIFYEVEVQMASSGSNTQGSTTRTITSLTQGPVDTTGYDGVNTLSFTLLDDAANALQIDFANAVLNPTGFSTGDSWAVGSGKTPGTPTVLGGTDHNELLNVFAAQSTGVHAGATAQSIMLTGNFTVDAAAPSGRSSTVAGKYGGSNSGIEINSNASTGAATTVNKPTVTTGTEGGGDPFVHFTGLTLITPLTWSGNPSNVWDINTTANFSGTKYTDGNAVIFADKAADGTTNVQNTNPISIVSGGVLPLSVTFSNNAATYKLTTAGSVGVGGTTSVAVTGGGTVILASPNTYSGGTTIGNGTLRATTGSLLSSGNVTIGAAGKLAVGDGTVLTPSTLSTGNQTWTGGGSYLPKLDDGSTSDLLSITGNLTLSGASPFKIVASAGDTAPNLNTSHAWEIADINGTLSGYTGTTPTQTGVDPGAQFSLDTSAFGTPSGTFSLSLLQVSAGHEQLFVDYTFASAPEPGTAMLVLAGVVPMLTRRRRTRSNTL